MQTSTNKSVHFLNFLIFSLDFSLWARLRITRRRRRLNYVILGSDGITSFSSRTGWSPSNASSLLSPISISMFLLAGPLVNRILIRTFMETYEIHAWSRSHQGHTKFQVHGQPDSFILSSWLSLIRSTLLVLIIVTRYLNFSIRHSR